MKKSKAGIWFPILIITLGVAWLLNTQHVLPGVDWIWTGSLGVCGVLVLVVSGVNKFTFVLGPFLVAGSILSVLRQTGHLTLNIEVPVLFIITGLLLLLAYLLPLQAPAFLAKDESEEKK